MAQRRSVMQGTLKRLHVYCKDVAGPQVRTDRPARGAPSAASESLHQSLSFHSPHTSLLFEHGVWQWQGSY